MDAKAAAIQDAVNAADLVVRAIDEYGRNSVETTGALKAAHRAVRRATNLGATEEDLRGIQPG